MCTCGALRSDSQVTASERSRTTRKLRALGDRAVSAASAVLVDGCRPRPGLDDVDAAVAGPVRERAAQGGGLHLLGGALVVAARLRAVDDATAGELRRAGRALTGAAGALLLVGLAATTADLAAGLGGVGALAGGGLLGHDDLVDQRDVDLRVEDLGGEVDLDGLDGFRGGSLVVAMISPPSAGLGGGAEDDEPTLGAGNGALEQDQALLGVDRVDGDVLGGHGVAPIRPAIRTPLKTRPGVAQAPIEPGLRWLRWAPCEAPTPWKP